MTISTKIASQNKYINKYILYVKTKNTEINLIFKAG